MIGKRIVFYADFHPDNRGSTPLGDVTKEKAQKGSEPPIAKPMPGIGRTSSLNWLIL